MLGEGFEPSTPGLEPGVVAVRLPELGTNPIVVPIVSCNESEPA